MKKELNQISVDIILPNYNSAPYLSETIDSIINQSFKNWKLIIVDGNSNEETKKILKKYMTNPNINIIWLKKNKRAGFCRNLAIRKSQSDYVSFIDSDDIWEKEKLFSQLEFMINNNYYFTYTNYLTFTSSKRNDNLRKIIPEKFFTFKKFIRNTSIGTSTMIINRFAIGTIKFSNTKICEDYFFKCQILKKIDYAYCFPEDLTKYRIRKNSLQSNKLRNFYWIWYINKEYNKLNSFENFLSILNISINSLRKYGFK
jgi:glycosyltransferase involved in cell wall biosynthesis